MFSRIKQYDNVEGADQPDLILEMLARLSQSILRENDLEKWVFTVTYSIHVPFSKEKS